MSSLRIRLALGGFVAVYVPIIVLLAVVVASEEDVQDAVTSGVLQEQVQRSTSPWVYVTAAALAPVAAWAAWVWAGRAVRPLTDISTAIRDVEASRLDRRLEMEDAPTEVAELAHQLDEMFDRLEAAATLQSQLVEDASHELRTPLALLTTNADVALAESPDDGEALAEALRRSKRTAARLTAIVDELLVDARGRARTITRNPCDLAELVSNCVDTLRPLAAEADVDLRAARADRVPSPVDEPSVTRAVTNVVENAIRHAPAGTTVDVAVSVRDARAEIAVTDCGPGVPESELDRVFERHWRADRSTSRTGLGLAIVRHVAQAHGGDARVVSPGPSGAGTVVTIELPITPPTPTSPAATP